MDSRPSKAAYLTQKLGEVQDDLKTARRAEAMTAITHLHRLELELESELRAALAAESEDAAPHPEGSPREALLRDVRRARRSAETKGSMVAAVNLLEREHELLNQLLQEQRDLEEQARLSESEGEILERFGAALQRLPEGLRRALLERLTASLS